jgi:FkbM family methyltransferase
MNLRQTLVRQTEKALRLLLPADARDDLFGLVLRRIPIPLLMKIPCSYSNYLKCYMPRRGDTIIDAGAHVGNCAVLFSRLVGPTGRVVCLEPFDASYSRLVERTRRWRLDNVIAIRKGLWKSRGVLSMRVFTDTTLGANIVNEVHKQVATSGHQIEVTSLDELTRELGLDHVEMVKMDIEGAEIEAVEGAGTVLLAMNAVFAIASYHIRDGQPTAFALERMFRERGCDVSTIQAPHKTTRGQSAARIRSDVGHS